MIKIFQLIHSIDIGGAEVVVFNLVEHCKYKNTDKFEFVIVELHPGKSDYSIDKKKELDSKNIKTICLYRGPKSSSLFIAPFRLVKYILKEKPDIVHSHTDLPDFVLATTIRLLHLFGIKVPKIIRTIHNTELWPTHNLIGKYTETALMNDYIIGVSEASLSAYNQIRIKNRLSVCQYQRVIYNGCKVPVNGRTLFKIDGQKINVAFCGRFEKQKGIDILIARIKEINRIFNNKFIFHVIGSGTLIDEVIQLSLENKNVLIYDSVNNIANKLYVFDFLIMPSRFEGLGLVSIEASFAKVPVIAAFAEGLNETLPNGWPLQFHLENQEELFTIFKRILNNEFDLPTLKEEAYQYVSDKFSLKQMIDAYSRLYLTCNA